MKICNFKLAILMYAISGLGLIYYLVSSFASLFVPPLLRVVLLVAICLCAYLGSIKLSKTSKSPQKIMKATFWGFFVLYIYFLVTLVCFDSYFGRVGIDGLSTWNAQTLSSYLQTHLNLIPFKTITKFVVAPFVDSNITSKQIITNILGNLVAFSPFAFFLPLLFKRLKKFGNFLLAMIAIVTVVELSQFALLTGYCEIDDLILNVGGASILFWILRIDKIKRLVDRLVGF